MAAIVQTGRKEQIDHLVQNFASKTTLQVEVIKQFYDASLENREKEKNSVSSSSKDWDWKTFPVNNTEKDVVSWLYTQIFDQFTDAELNALCNQSEALTNLVISNLREVTINQALSRFREITNTLLKKSSVESLSESMETVQIESNSSLKEQYQIKDSDSLEKIFSFRLHTDQIEDFLKQCKQISVQEIKELISEQKYQKVLGYLWANEEGNLKFLRELRSSEHVPLLYELGLAEARELLRKVKISSTENIAIGKRNLPLVEKSNMNLAVDFCRKILPLFAYAFYRAHQDAFCLTNNQEAKKMISKMNADYLEQLDQLCKYEVGIPLNRIKLCLLDEYDIRDYFTQLVREGAFKEDLPHPSWLGESKEKAPEIYIKRLGFVRLVSKEIDRVFHPSAVLSGPLREIDMFARIQSVADGKNL